MGSPTDAHSPLVEMMVGVHFRPVTGLRLFELTPLADRWRSRYPHIAELPPLPAWPAPGSLPVVGVTPDRPFRLWFTDGAENELVQLQPDCLLINWRALKNGTYPGYVYMKRLLAARLDDLNAFLNSNIAEPLSVVGAEMLYMNAIEVERNTASLQKVMRG